MAIYFRTPNGNVRQASTIHMNVGNNVGEKRIQSIYYGIGSGKSRLVYTGSEEALLDGGYNNITYLYLNVKEIPENATYIINAPKSPYKIFTTVNNKNLSKGIVYTKAKKIKIVNRTDVRYLFYKGNNIPFDKISFENNCNKFQYVFYYANLVGNLEQYINDLPNKPYYNYFRQSGCFYRAKYKNFTQLNFVINNNIKYLGWALFPNTDLNIYYPSSLNQNTAFLATGGNFNSFYLKADCPIIDGYYTNLLFFSHNTVIEFNSARFIPSPHQYEERRAGDFSSSDYIEPHIYYNFKNVITIDPFGETYIQTEILLNGKEYNSKNYFSFIFPPDGSYTDANNGNDSIFICNFNNFKYNYFFIYFNNFYFVNRFVNKSEYAAIAYMRLYTKGYSYGGSWSSYTVNNIQVTQDTFTVVNINNKVYRPDDLNHTQPYYGSGNYGAYRGANCGVYLLYDFRN